MSLLLRKEKRKETQSPKARIQRQHGGWLGRAVVHKLLTIVVMLALGGCAAPQEQVLKKLPSASPAKAGNLVNCTTRYHASTICN